MGLRPEEKILENKQWLGIYFSGGSDATKWLFIKASGDHKEIRGFKGYYTSAFIFRADQIGENIQFKLIKNRFGLSNFTKTIKKENWDKAPDPIKSFALWAYVQEANARIFAGKPAINVLRDGGLI